MKNIIKYQRAISLYDEALQILCCGKGDIRSRFSMIDKEFFCLKLDQLPDIEGIRDDFQLLNEAIRKSQPKGDEGHIEATILRSRLNTLENIAQKIWEIHHKLRTSIRFHGDLMADAGTSFKVSTGELKDLPYPESEK